MPKAIHINLRVPPELHRKLTKSAASRTPKQSLNSEIIHLLDVSLRVENLTGRARDLKGTMAKLMEQMAKADEMNERLSQTMERFEVMHGDKRGAKE
jgi:hypothetical protein